MEQIVLQQTCNKIVINKKANTEENNKEIFVTETKTEGISTEDTNTLGINKPDTKTGTKYNYMEFMDSRLDKSILPNSKYNYDPKDLIFWWWNDVNNTKPIELTVALPALNAEKIIWLALESLKNQTNINFAWELICLEEYGKSRSIIQSYIGQLPGCVRIVHKIVHPSESIYKIKKFTLLEKWIHISKYADDSSKIFVKHACDCYSPPKRLYIHYEHFKNPDCYYSTQPKGYFYNILTDKFFLYNGYLSKRYGILKNIINPHLNMALRTELMKTVPLPHKPKLVGIDNYIYGYIALKNKNKIICVDNSIDPDNWKFSLDTDGYNIISIKRRLGYIKRLNSRINPTSNEKAMSELHIPEYIFERLKLLSNIKN